MYSLCNHLSKGCALELRVMASSLAGPNSYKQIEYERFPEVYPFGYKVYFYRPFGRITFSVKMLLDLYKMVSWSDIVHITSAYSAITLPALFFCRVLKKPVVLSPRGAFQQWHGSRRKVFKKIWNMIAKTLLSPRLSFLHVTSSLEKKESQVIFPKLSIFCIPNGVCIPKVISKNSKDSSSFEIIFIGRIHPKKGIEIIINSMEKLRDKNVSLKIYGDGDKGYIQDLKKNISSKGLQNKIVFKGHINGIEISNAFMASDICVVPSFTENFGMVVAESLAHGVPVIASMGTPWEGLVKNHCGYWVENTVGNFVTSIDRMMHADLSEMGVNGRKWMQSDFCWERIAKRMHFTYFKILSGNFDEHLGVGDEV